MSDIFIIRQPVFDRADATVGYELRFREGADGGDPFARSYLSGTFDDLRGGLPAYVRCSRQQLVERLFDTADARALIVLLPPELLPDPETVDAVRALARAGIQVGVDDFDDAPGAPASLDELLGHVSLARIDLRAHGPA